MAAQTGGSKPLQVEEAIKTAIEFETKVRDVYRDAMSQAKDPVGKRVFKVLAEEEQGHLDYLNHRMEELKSTGKITNEKLKSVIPSPDQIREQVGKLEKSLAPTVSDTELKLLTKAVEVEQETSNYYRKLVSELSGEEQAMFTQFMEIEEGHVAIVQAELDSASGMGFFFGMEEFNIEIG